MPEPVVNLAAIHVNAGRYEQARQLLVAALNSHSIYAKIYESLNNLHATMASRAYQNALALDGEAVQPKPSTVSALISWPAEAVPGAMTARGRPAAATELSKVVPAPRDESRPASPQAWLA